MSKSSERALMESINVLDARLNAHQKRLEDHERYLLKLDAALDNLEERVLRLDDLKKRLALAEGSSGTDRTESGDLGRMRVERDLALTAEASWRRTAEAFERKLTEYEQSEAFRRKIFQEKLATVQKMCDESQLQLIEALKAKRFAGFTEEEREVLHAALSPFQGRHLVALLEELENV